MHLHVHAALFTIAKIRKQPKCPLMGEQIKKYGITVHRIIIQPKKEENAALCGNIDPVS